MGSGTLALMAMERPPKSHGLPAEVLSVPAEHADAILHGVGDVLPGDSEAWAGWGSNAARCD